MKKCLKILGIIIGILVLVILAYVSYLLLSYHRIEDRQQLAIETPVSKNGEAEAETEKTSLQTGKGYTVVTYNIGFGAYTPDFSFFMDGGKSSRAESREQVIGTIEGAAELTASFSPDFVLFQEVDLDATRSYHVNQYELINQTFGNYYRTFAVNYDSAFLAYPFLEPHGKSKSGIALYSKYPVTESVRRSLPISTSLSKFFDLDRCYSISRIPVEGGEKELVIINVHMSAYGNSDEIRKGQIEMLCEDMRKEYEKGNYVICGGDFNHDLKVLEDDGSERESWAYPFPRESLPEHFSFCMDSFTEEEKEQMWDSARNADMEYVPGVTYTVTLDGFIVSDNIVCLEYANMWSGYSYSDHDPVFLRYMLLE